MPRRIAVFTKHNSDRKITENQRNNWNKTCQLTSIFWAHNIEYYHFCRLYGNAYAIMRKHGKQGNMQMYMLRLCFQWSEGHEPNPFFPCKKQHNHQATLATAALTPFSSPPSQQLVGALAWPLWHPICHRPFQFQPWQSGKFWIQNCGKFTLLSTSHKIACVALCFKNHVLIFS